MYIFFSFFVIITQVKPPTSTKKVDTESPSVITKKKPSPKSAKKTVASKLIVADEHDESSILTPRPRRNVARRPMLVDSEDESDKENESDSSYTNDSYSDSDMLTDDNSDAETQSIPKGLLT